MYEVFFRSFREKVPLSDSDELMIKTHLTPKKLRKRQYLHQEGDICKKFAFVEKGVLRNYTVDANGQEHNFAFALEGYTIGDLSSFLSEQISTQNIDAIEECELAMISKSAHDELLATMPTYETYFRILITEAFVALLRKEP